MDLDAGMNRGNDQPEEWNSPQFHQSSRDAEESLICEALICEIRDAKRWVSVVEAWQALLAVRRMADSLRDRRRMRDATCESMEPQRAP